MKIIRLAQTINNDTVQALEDKKSGWLTNSGELYPINMFSHFESMESIVKSNESKYSQLAEMLYDMRDSLDRLYEDIAEEVEGTGGGWHSYDMAKDKEEWNLLDKAYEHGWLRLAVIEANRTLMVEGSPTGIKSQYPNLKRILRELNDMVLDEMEYGKQPFEYTLNVRHIS